MFGFGKKKNGKSKNETKKYKYGKLPIKKYYRGGRHPHIIVEEANNQIYSVGITHSDHSGNHKLKDVHESNGVIAHMNHYVTKDKNKNYNSTPEDFNVDIDSENRAKEMVKKYKKKEVGQTS